MAYWGKIIGGVAGFAMGGPAGAIMGVGLGHAADTGNMAPLRDAMSRAGPLRGSGLGAMLRNRADATGHALHAARIAALLGQRDQVFAIAVVVLSAKLAKSDGAVNRAEIDAFKRHFRIPAGQERMVGRLFDQARDSPEAYQEYAARLGEVFADSPAVLGEVLAALFAIARADAPINGRETAFLRGVHAALGLDEAIWRLAGEGRVGGGRDMVDPYAVLGVSRDIGDAELRATWKKLMREHHPDSLAARGVPEDFIARASAKVAEINAAWDTIKRERGI
ncbi:MAG: TerB family tellurite resistance protein [Rhodospirillales bacterium]|nr:TerB family tellurite resistance protein [Rhodospirillales bacterium]